MAARKLRPYFQAHTIKVLTDQPLRQVLHRPDISGRLMKWAVELSEFDIQYVPRPSIKAQVLADFVAECTIPQQLVDPEAVQLSVAERAVPEECIAEEIQTEIRPPSAEQDSITSTPTWELVANQIQGVYEARDERMIKYLAKVRQLFSRFASFEVIRVPRTENAKADVLSKLAASGYTTLGSIHMEFLQRSSIESKAIEVMQLEDEPCWMDEIMGYLRDARLPEDKKEARKVIQRAARFSFSGDNLYKRSYTLPYLKCLRPSDAAYAL
ncbi:uncharacterized protein LOC143891180 [Tasmannia lanceolata]|uniref:uncharacterized protein LOC143891180 n=1 Tax=Tasmannia lanceolata TaxID=3420 RepID=UPI004062DEA6